MMTVEEKPDVTYKDVGGCKDQIEKMREVVELPLLHVCTSVTLCYYCLLYIYSLKNLLLLVLILQRECLCMDPLEQERHYLHEQ